MNGPPVAKNRLSIAEVTEVSLCSAGDNPHAKIVIAKARPDWNPDKDVAKGEVSGMPEHEPDKGDQGELLALIVEQNARLAKMLTVAVGVDPDEDEEAFSKALSAIAKARYAEDDEDDDLDDEYEEYDDEDEDEVVKAEADDEDYEDEDDDFDDEDVLKSDPRLARVIAGYEAQIKKANQTAEAAARMALAERERTLDDRFAKSAAALENVAVADDDLSALLKDLYLASPQLCERVEKALAHASTIVGESEAFEVAGYTPSAVRKHANSLEDLEALMDGAISKSNGSLTPEQAFVAALEQRPGVYDEWAMDQAMQRMGGRG